MSNKPGLLARLMGRQNPAPVVSSLAMAVLNRSLLAEPTLAQAIIGGYLSGTITSDDTQMRVERVPMAAPAADKETSGSIGVLNITGGLVNRPMPGASGPGPMSYAAIREEFDELLNDDSVTAIVLRIESPGGMASGCFDLSDHIFRARGKKPLIGLADDYAYSAGYALIAACDEIWVSRTGGVGSVGVCGFHEDWSEGNRQMGVKVTAVYAGAHKIDFSQDFPLSHDARTRWQAWIDDDYSMFVATIARYRGLAEDVVRGTEANIYFGQQAIDAGMATHLGTWQDVVAHLGSPGVDPPAAGNDGADDDDDALAIDAPATAAAIGTTTGDGTGEALPAVDASAYPDNASELAVDAPPATENASAAAGDAPLPAADQQPSFAERATALAVAVTGSDLPATLQVALIRRAPRDNESPADAIAYAVAVRDACAAAMKGGESLAPDYVGNNTDLATVRQQLLGLKADDGPGEIVTALPASDAEKRAAATRAALNPVAIYQKRGN